MPDGFRVEARGLTQLQSWLRNRSLAVSDWRTFWTEKFAPEFYDQLQDNWSSQGGAVGGWSALAASTLKRKGGAGSILVEKTHLRTSMTWLGSAPGKGGIFRPSKKSFIVGTTLPYGEAHQKGLGRVPARRFMFIRQKERYTELLKEWCNELFAQGRPLP